MVSTILAFVTLFLMIVKLMAVRFSECLVSAKHYYEHLDFSTTIQCMWYGLDMFFPLKVNVLEHQSKCGDVEAGSRTLKRRGLVEGN